MADYVIVHSQNMKETALQMGIHASKIEMIPHGTTIPKLYGLKRNKVTFFGEPVRRKGIFPILQALRILKEQKKKLILNIYGVYSQAQKQETITTARQLGVDDCLFWGGQLDEEDFDRKMQESIFTLALYPYDNPGSSIITRAMSNATPVIASNTRSNVEYLSETGIFVPLDSPESIADSMMRILNDKQLGRKLGEQSRSRVINLFSWETVAGRTISIYTKVLN